MKIPTISRIVSVRKLVRLQQYIAAFFVRHALSSVILLVAFVCAGGVMIRGNVTTQQSVKEVERTNKVAEIAQVKSHEKREAVIAEKKEAQAKADTIKKNEAQAASQAIQSIPGLDVDSTAILPDKVINVGPNAHSSGIPFSTPYLILSLNTASPWIASFTATNFQPTDISVYARRVGSDEVSHIITPAGLYVPPAGTHAAGVISLLLNSANASQYEVSVCAMQNGTCVVRSNTIVMTIPSHP